MDHRVKMAGKENPDLLELKALKESMAQGDHLARGVPQATKEHLDQRDLRVQLEQMVQMDERVHQDLMDLQVIEAPRDFLGPLACRDLGVLKELRGRGELLEHQERKDLQGHQDSPDHLDLLDREGRGEREGLLESLGPQVLGEEWEIKGHQVMLDLWEHLDQLGELDFLVN